MNVKDDGKTVHEIGYRDFIGGQGDFWDVIGDLQFSFLKERGLKPTDVFVDVACGSLRGGVRYINYLNSGNYLGVDQHIELIIYGVMNELGPKVFAAKRPSFFVTGTFEFEKLTASPNFGIAQSLFTHLTTDDIRLCLRNLARIAAPKCRFFGTFFEVADSVENLDESHSLKMFHYTKEEMETLGEETGWIPNYIGNWSHPRQQKMIEYVLR